MRENMDHCILNTVHFVHFMLLLVATDSDHYRNLRIEVTPRYGVCDKMLSEKRLIFPLAGAHPADSSNSTTFNPLLCPGIRGWRRAIQ